MHTPNTHCTTCLSIPAPSRGLWAALGGVPKYSRCLPTDLPLVPLLAVGEIFPVGANQLLHGTDVGAAGRTKQSRVCQGPNSNQRGWWGGSSGTGVCWGAHKAKAEREELSTHSAMLCFSLPRAKAPHLAIFYLPPKYIGTMVWLRFLWQTAIYSLKSLLKPNIFRQSFKTFPKFLWFRS